MILIPTKSAEDWKQFLKEPYHWKTGHSAKSLAYCWEEANGLPLDVKTVFDKSYTPFQNLEILLVIPEYKVLLDTPYAPSQNDLFVLGRYEESLVVIMVEGKVNEPLDVTVEDWLKAGGKTKKKSRIARLDYLLDILEFDVNKNVEKLRYQLLHRAASVIITARKFHAKYGAILIHSFSQNHQWFDDFKTFYEFSQSQINRKQSIAVNEMQFDFVRKEDSDEEVYLYFSWVTGDKKYLTR